MRLRGRRGIEWADCVWANCGRTGCAITLEEQILEVVVRAPQKDEVLYQQGQALVTVVRDMLAPNFPSGKYSGPMDH